MDNFVGIGGRITLPTNDNFEHPDTTNDPFTIRSGSIGIAGDGVVVTASEINERNYGSEPLVVHTRGVFRFAKSSGVGLVLLSPVYFDKFTGEIEFAAAADRIFAGSVVADHGEWFDLDINQRYGGEDTP